MKLLIFFCLLAVVYGLPQEIADKIKEKIAKYAGECQGEIGASDDDIAPMKAHELPTTDKGKCFAACMHKKFGIQNADGKIDKDAIHGLLDKIKPVDPDLHEKMKKVSDICCAEVTDAANECETAYNMLVCAYREKKANGIESFGL